MTTAEIVATAGHSLTVLLLVVAAVLPTKRRRAERNDVETPEERYRSEVPA